MAGPGSDRLADEVLKDLAPQIEQIRKTFQAPSLAIGVTHKSARSFRGFGYANAETGRVPDENTIYGMGSCTKAFTSTLLARLAQDGKLDLDVPVSDRFSGLNTVFNPLVAAEMTVRDMASHCIGLDQLLYEVVGKHGSILAQRSDVVSIFNNLPKVAEFRSEWMYDNWLFALAGVVITQLTGKTFGTLVKDEIFTRLGMNRSYFEYPPDDNHAIPYLIFDDKPIEPQPLPSFGDGDAFDSSGSMRSCVKDMLTWTEALIKVHKDSYPRSSFVSWLSSWFTGRKDRSSISLGSDLHDALATIQEPYFPLAKDDNQKYAMGLYSFHLPTPEINTVTNQDVISTPYTLGQHSKARRVIGHTGEYGGFLSVYWTFPDEEAAIVVLCNSFEINGDPTNIIAQLIAQELFEMKPKLDFTQITREITLNAQKRWTHLQRDWERNRHLGTQPAALSSYSGAFKHSGLNMSLVFSVVESHPIPHMRMIINGLPDQVFDLYHYHHNSWTFLPETRDACIAHGYSAFISEWENVVLDFENDVDGVFQVVNWKLSPDARVNQTIFQRE
ncbi:hypothetical protein IL306_008834 [Fusarium sp. DS 682]|nr:hypothetical protein IL306_008834 [Fusarium sp. DS 682]